MAIMMRGLVLAVDDPGRQPRSLTVHFLRPPQAGTITVHPRVERSGRSLTSASVSPEQEGVPVGFGLATFSGPWPGPLLADAPMPAVQPPGDRLDPQQQLPERDRPPSSIS